MRRDCCQTVGFLFLILWWTCLLCEQPQCGREHRFKQRYIRLKCATLPAADSSLTSTRVCLGSCCTPITAGSIRTQGEPALSPGLNAVFFCSFCPQMLMGCGLKLLGFFFGGVGWGCKCEWSELPNKFLFFFNLDLVFELAGVRVFEFPVSMLQIVSQL